MSSRSVGDEVPCRDTLGLQHDVAGCFVPTMRSQGVEEGSCCTPHGRVSAELLTHSLLWLNGPNKAGY